MKKNEQDSFDKMDETKMNDLLGELVGTTFWQAVLRFNRIKDAQAINSLATLDPFKDPTAMARTQGIRIGTYNLEQEASRLYKKMMEEEEVKK